LNGRVVTELGTKADPDRDEIKVDGRRLKSAPVKRYLLMNKPVGVMSTRSDPQRRTTVVDLVSQAGLTGYFYPVGRLDYDSEGLIILTNDGAFAQRVSHPSYELERTYEALVEGVPDERDLERLRKGVPVEGERTQPARVQLKRVMPTKRGEQSLLEIVIHEGRNRQIRRMADAIAHPVARLKRVRIGNVTDSSLKPGHFRDLNPGEIRDLLKAKPGEFGVSAGPRTSDRRPAAGARRPAGSDERRPAPSGARQPTPRPSANRRLSSGGDAPPRSNWRRGPGRRPSARPRGKD
jgi:pseudouridine synthase